MKKKATLITSALILALIPIVCFAQDLTTKTHSQRDLVVSAAGAETDLVAATGFNVGTPNPGTDALNPKDLVKIFGAGDQTEANGVILTCFATGDAADTATASIYGISDGGCPEKIASIVWTLGDAVRSSGVQWADTATVTDYTFPAVYVGDSGNDRAVRVMFDTIGYKKLYAVVYAQTGSPTNITIKMRGY